MSMYDLQGLDLPSWGGNDHGHDDDKKKGKHSKKRNKSCYSKCCHKDY